MATAKEKELETKLRDVLMTLEAHGIRKPVERAEKAEDRGDYIAHGSEEHALFLGLVEVNGDTTKKLTFTSPRTERVFCLEDEVTQFMQYPDPRQVAGLVLKQKVNELEMKPEVPGTAPPIWRPRDVPV